MIDHSRHLKQNFSFQQRLLRWSMYCAVSVLITGMSVLAGWWDIGSLKQAMAHFAVMDSLTAINFILAALSFLLLPPSGTFILPRTFPPGKKIIAGQLLAGIVLMISGLKVAATFHLIHFSDQMTAMTAFCFFLSGVSLLLLNYETKNRKMPAHYLALAIGLFGLFSMVGYLYRVQASYGLHGYTPMAIHTAACFLLISLSLLFANPRKGIMREFTTSFAGSLMARRLLPLVIVFPILLGYARLWEGWEGLYSTEFGITALILSIVFVFIILIWYNAKLMNKRDIVGKEAELTLKESEELYRLIVNSVKDYAILMLDPGGNIVSWNEGAERIKGYNEREIIGKHMSIFYTMEDLIRGDPGHNLAAARQAGRLEKEGWRIGKDGKPFWANIVFTALYGRSGALQGFVKVTRDNTERKKIEQQLQQFNKDLEVQVRKKTAESIAIFERITDAFIALDKHLCYTYLNKKAGEMMRHDPESLIGKCVWDVFPDAIGSSTYHAINKAMAEQKNSTNTDYYAPLDLWQENHLYPSSDGLSMFIRDITEQKRIEKEIIDYKYALDQTSIISVTDQNGVIMHVNENFCKNSKFTEEELIGQDHRILNSGYHSKEFMDDLKETISAGGIWKGEFCNKAKDGTTYWVDTTIIPFINEKGSPYEYIAIRDDITERKNKEHQLQKSYQEIRQLASHLQDIREEERAGIAREIHDELGQQLTGLKMDMSWVLKKISPREDDQIRQKINSMLELSDTAVKTIRRIATDLRPSILDDLGLVAAIEWQCQEFQKRSGTPCECLTSLTEFDFPSPIAIGLFRICQESLTNIARHANAKHVYITLNQQENGAVQLKIQDDGKGFIPNEIGTKKTLGLLGMKERALMMGGEFEIISKPGEGTALFVTIPVTIDTKKS